MEEDGTDTMILRQSKPSLIPTDSSPNINRSEVQGIRHRLPSIRPDRDRARVQRCRRCAGPAVQGGSAQPGSAAGVLLGRGRVVRQRSTYAQPEP